jgi:AAA15 family ATPase/GTPase
MKMTVIDVIKNNKILLLDDIEKSLHSKIAEYIVGLFHASDSAQILYITHNSNLLNLNKLRKDQIYFVNKKDDGSSDLYLLLDYKDFRDTKDVEKAYLMLLRNRRLKSSEMTKNHTVRNTVTILPKKN